MVKKISWGVSTPSQNVVDKITGKLDNKLKEHVNYFPGELNPEYYPVTINDKTKEYWSNDDFKPDIWVRREDERGEVKIDIFEVWDKQSNGKSILEFIWVNRVKNLGNYYIILTGKKLDDPEFSYTFRDFIFCDFIRPKYLSLDKIHFISIDLEDENDEGMAEIEKIIESYKS